jgi:hypothetical protein
MKGLNFVLSIYMRSFFGEVVEGWVSVVGEQLLCVVGGAKFFCVVSDAKLFCVVDVGSRCFSC